jgi:hypothetical protein
VLELEMVGPAGEVGVEMAPERRPVVGVDPVQPLARAVADVAPGEAQHRLPARREEHAVGHQVPVPQPVVGAAHREGVALLGVAQLVLGDLPLDGVEDGAHQQPGVGLALDEVVLGPLAHRLHRELVVVETGENDDRGPRRRRVRLAEGLQAEAVGEREVEQHDVEALLPEALEPAVEAVHVGDLGAHPLRALQLAPDQVGVVGAVLDQQHPVDRLPARFSQAHVAHHAPSSG